MGSTGISEMSELHRSFYLLVNDNKRIYCTVSPPCTLAEFIAANGKAEVAPEYVYPAHDWAQYVARGETKDDRRARYGEVPEADKKEVWALLNAMKGQNNE
jgi:hypothetical protein